MGAIRNHLGKADSVQLSMDNMLSGLNVIRPSAMREISLQVPEVRKSYILP